MPWEPHSTSMGMDVCAGLGEKQFCVPQQIRFSCVKVLMKDIVTPVPQEEVKTVIRKCLEQAALVNYTRLSEYAKIEGKALSFWNYNFSCVSRRQLRWLWSSLKKAHLLITLLSIKLLWFRIIFVVLASAAVKNGNYANHFFFWKTERKQLKRTVAFFSFDR